METPAGRGEGFGVHQQRPHPSKSAPNPQRPKGVVTGFHETLGDLYAAFDGAASHVDPGVRTSRFAARLAPYPTQQLAELALVAAGAVLGGAA